MKSKEELLREFKRQYDFLKLNKFIKVIKSPVRMFIPNFMEKIGLTKTVKAKTFFEEEMFVVLPEIVSRTIFRYGLYEPYLTYVLLHYLDKGMNFIDVGAHLGYYSLLARKLVGESGEVHCFEPTPSTYSILIKNLGKYKNIYANNQALWSESGKIKIRDYGIVFSAFNSIFSPRLPEGKINNFQETEIECLTLDEYVLKKNIKPNFIKIDAESAEFQILKGSIQTINLYKPIISLEVGDYLPDVPKSKELISF
ncbi:MAG: FkbM family methyltransferase [Caldimicrobium sp.]